MRRIVWIIWGLAVWTGSEPAVQGQDREYIFDHFNISNGLISDNVSKIFIDSDGHAWIITYNGLQKYNGYEFQTYTSSAGREGTLSSNFVEDIFEDREGDLIVVLEDGIDVFDKETGRFTNLLSDLPFASVRRNEVSRLSSAVQDRNGYIWVNCNNRLVRIDSTKQDFMVYKEEFRGRFVLGKDRATLWIINEQDIKAYDTERNILTVTQISDIPGGKGIRRLNTIFFDAKGVCWLGTTDGFFLFDTEYYRIVSPGEVIPGLQAERSPVLTGEINSIYEDYKRILWIASGESLCGIDRESGVVQHLRHEFENPNSILDEQISGIHGNRKGVIWLTYLNEGFTRINIRTSNFRSYRYRTNQAKSLGGNAVRSVFKDRNGYLWVGLYNNGLDRIHPGSGEIAHFVHTPGDPGSVVSNYISSLFVDSHKRLWVGSHDNGLCYADRVYGESLRFIVPPFLSGNHEIYHIQEDKLGRVWFGTRQGLGMYDRRSGSFHWILEKHNVQSFVFENESIWMATWNNGLCKLGFQADGFSSAVPHYDPAISIYYPESDTIPIHSRHSSPSSDALRNCISIYRDGEGRIWLGTYDRGLVRATVSGGEISYTAYGVSKGAPSNAVYGVSGDRKGSIWISTANGLGKFDPENESFENYYREDGLLSNYFMWKAYFRASGGELFFGSVDGLNAFYPEEIVRNTARPEAIISELRIQNRLVDCGDTVNGDVILDRHITYKDTIVLNHRNRNFSFRYYTAGHLNPHRLKYAYMLAGFDENWILTEEGRRSASYNNLKAGTYHFRVRVTDRENYWPPGYEEKTVVILPPWWKSNLAIIAYFVLFTSLLFLIIYTLVRFLGMKHELIFSEKLHQSKLTFFTNISHELKTPLSLIKAPLEDMLNVNTLSPHNRKNLQMARKNADDLLNLVNELMEFRRTDTGISKLKCEEIELNPFVAEIAGQFEPMAEQKGVHFYNNIPRESLKIWADVPKFRKIVNNLLENALTYTGEGGLVTISVIGNPAEHRFRSNYHVLRTDRSRKDLDYIGILVSDTGVGISKESLPRIFDRYFQIEAERADRHMGSGIGLALVRNLVLMHQGEIRVASERGAGSEILVCIPLGDKHLTDKDKAATPSVKEPDPPESRKPGKPVPPSRTAEVSGREDAKPGILLVEDHAELRQYLQEQLSDSYRILEASNGREGLEILERERPDLIVTDWIMPVMDGAAFIREIRSNERFCSIPVILLTAKDELLDRQEGLDLGADQVVTKPFNMQLLKTSVKRVVANNRERIRAYSKESMENLLEVHGNRDARFMEQVEKTVGDHLRDPSLNAGVIARELGMSRTSAYERIKTVTGLTVGEYIQKIRLRHAVKLMLYEGMTVSEVYVAVGFSSSSYFIRLFKKHYNSTPGEYIRNYLKTASN